MSHLSREQIIEEEVLIVRHSGELPEVVFHSSLAYLREDPEGPQIELNDGEISILQQAAKERYLEIICRDLDSGNRDLSLFRGMQRALVNWQRFVRFCERIGASPAPYQAHVAQCLLRFINQEQQDVDSGKRVSSLNCTAEDLKTFVELLNVDSLSLPSGWEKLCCTS